MAVDKRLEALERLVSQMRAEQDQFSSFKTLAEGAPHLLNVTSVMQSYEKRLRQISQSLQTNRAYIKTVKDAIPTYEGKMRAQVEQAVQRRERNAKQLEAKINSLENSYSQMTSQMQATTDGIEARVKSEIAAGIRNIESQMESKKKQFVGKVKTANGKLKSRTSEMNHEAEVVRQQLLKFQDANQAKLKALAPDKVDPNSEAGRESLTKWLIEESSKEIMENIADRKDGFVFKFRTLSLQYHQEMLTFRAQLQEARNRVINPTIKASKKIDIRLSSGIDIIKNKTSAVKFFSEGARDNLMEIITTYDEMVDEMIRKPRRAEEILLYKRYSDDTKEKLLIVERSSEDQLIGIDEIMREAKGFLKSVKSKKLPVELANIERDIGVFRKNIKDNFNGLRAMIESFQTKATSIARQLAMQQSPNKPENVPAYEESKTT